MTVEDVENAMWSEAKTYADENGLVPDRSNIGSFNPHQADSLVWSFKPESRERLTSKKVKYTGTARGRVYVPAGSGPLAALTHARNIQARFLGKTYSGAEAMDESYVAPMEREGSSYATDVIIPWEWCDKVVSGGRVTAATQEQPDIVEAYTMIRTAWRDYVVPSLGGADTYFENPEGEVTMPFILGNIKTFPPFPIEVGTVRTTGRVICALHYPPGAGFSAIWSAIRAIVEAFDAKTYGNIKFQTPVISRIGRSDINSWQANVRLPFHFEVNNL